MISIMDVHKQNVMILGFGVTGKSLAKSLINLKAKVFVFDEHFRKESLDRECVINVVSEKEVSTKLDSMNYLFKSPGVSPDHFLVQMAKKKKVPIVNDIELLFHYFPSEIVAVTGTNGKTTTVHMIAQALKNAGLKVFLGGNVGIPASEVFNDQYDIAVLELSSFQLENIDKFQAKVNVILNITPSHSERYINFEDYKKAKLNLLKNFDHLNNFFITADTDSELYQLSNFKIDIACELKKLSQQKLNLTNVFKKNFVFCLKVLECLKIDKKYAYEMIENFKTINYRCQFIYKLGKIFVNDAKSTNWASTLEALRSSLEIMPEKSLTRCLILGGQLRNNDLNLSREDKEEIESLCEVILTLGEAGEFICRDFSKAINFGSLSKAFKNSLNCDVIIFSPGFPSFDQFQNYEHRGRIFNNLIEQLDWSEPSSSNI